MRSCIAAVALAATLTMPLCVSGDQLEVDITASVVATVQFKTGTQFVDSFTGLNVTLAEVSGVGLYGDDTLFGLDDGGVVVQGKISLDGKTLANALRDDIAAETTTPPSPTNRNLAIEFTSRSRIRNRDGIVSNSSTFGLDAEGIVIVTDPALLSVSVQAALETNTPSSSSSSFNFNFNTTFPIILISSEFDAWSYSDIGVYIHSIDSSNQSFYTYVASAVQFPSIFAESNQRINKGMEALCSTPDGTSIVAGFEQNLIRDPTGGVRLSMYDLSTGNLTHMLRYELDHPEKGTGLTELLALDNEGLDGGTLLSLERSFSIETGSIIKLYVVSTARARDVAHCDRLLDAQQTCGVVRKQLLLDLNKVEGLRVDNFEAMSVVARVDTAGGARTALYVLLATDNNEKIEQLTEFVLVRLDIENKETDEILPDFDCPLATSDELPLAECGGGAKRADGVPWGVYSLWVLVLGSCCVLAQPANRMCRLFATPVLAGAGEDGGMMDGDAYNVVDVDGVQTIVQTGTSDAENGNIYGNEVPRRGNVTLPSRSTAADAYDQSQDDGGMIELQLI